MIQDVGKWMISPFAQNEFCPQLEGQLGSAFSLLRNCSRMDNDCD